MSRQPWRGHMGNLVPCQIRDRLFKPGRLVGLFTEGHPELANGSEALRTDGVTLEEVGKALGVTRERARQLEMQALRKCRRWCERNGYKFEDLAASWPQPERVRRDWRDY